MTRLINTKCGKCSAKGTLKIGKTIVDMHSLLKKEVLGLVRNDPYCFQCGTTFPDGFWKEINGYIYRIYSKNKG
jgi:hypothetical protein